MKFIKHPTLFLTKEDIASLEFLAEVCENMNFAPTELCEAVREYETVFTEDGMKISIKDSAPFFGDWGYHKETNSLHFTEDGFAKIRFVNDLWKLTRVSPTTMVENIVYKKLPFTYDCELKIIYIKYEK